MDQGRHCELERQVVKECLGFEGLEIHQLIVNNDLIEIQLILIDRGVMSKEQKQQYLFVEVIDGGYDPEEFQEYLELMKPGGLDINKWELSELKEMVQGFKAQKQGRDVEVDSKQQQVPKEHPKFGQRVISIPKKQSKQEKQGNEQEPGTPIHKVTDIPQSPQKKRSKVSEQKQSIEGQRKHKESDQDIEVIEAEEVIIEQNKYSSHNNNSQQLFSKTIECRRTEPNSIFTKDVEVKIEKYQKMEGGFFEQNYVMYRVVTSQEMWAVMRRYSDFQWLRNQLDMRHPGYPIPPIAKKGAFRKFDDNYLKKRMAILQNFMNKILTIPELKAEQIIEDFLKIDDPVLYAKAKKQKQRKEGVTKLEKLSTLKGKVNLVIDPTITKYLSSTEKYLGVTELKMEKVYKDWKSLAGNFEESTRVLKDLNHTFQVMEKEERKFYSKTESQEKKTGSSLYKLLSNMTLDWANILEDQQKTIQDLLYSVYKYEYINLISLAEVVRKVHMERNQYLEYKFKIERLKEKLYEDRNFSRMDLPTNVYDKVVKSRESVPKAELFEMMVPKDMQQQQKLKESYALLNFQCYEEVQRYFNHNPKALSGVIQQVGTRQSINTSKSMMLWADTITDSMSLKEGKAIQQFEI